MSTHPALVTVQPSAPLEVYQVPTPVPGSDEVKVLVQYTTTSPIDLQQAAGHLLVTPPQILGSSVAGTVVEVGSDVRSLKVGDRVFGYTFRGGREKTYQLFVVTSEKQLAKLPRRVDTDTDEEDGDQDGGRFFSMEECVSIANNFVSAWHAITADLGLDLPWPKPAWFQRQHNDPNRPESILIWGGGSSVGQYALQILSWYGYKDITVIASANHHEKLRKYGAARCVSYSDGDIVGVLNEMQEKETNHHHFSHVLDCIGNVKSSIEPISRIARGPSRVAVFLPVIVKDATRDTLPEYALDINTYANWAEGVVAAGIRTHFYTKNEYLAEHLQSQIMPAALHLGIVEPNQRVLVEGKTMLERAEKALQLLKDKQVRGAKLVWKVAEDDQVEKILRKLEAQSS